MKAPKRWVPERNVDGIEVPRERKPPRRMENERIPDRKKRKVKKRKVIRNQNLILTSTAVVGDEDLETQYRKKTMNYFRNESAKRVGFLMLTMGVVLDVWVRVLVGARRGKSRLRTVDIMGVKMLIPSRRWKFDGQERVEKLFGDLMRNWNVIRFTTEANTKKEVIIEYLQLTSMKGGQDLFECKIKTTGRNIT